MSGYNFTDRVRTVLQMAREDAARLQHEYVGTEHILIALTREGDGVAVEVLTSLGVELAQIRQNVEAVVKPGKEAAAHDHELPYTSRAKKVLELAMMAARDLKYTYVGTEHLLLGLLREEKGIAAQVLVQSGVTLDRVTTELGAVPSTDGEMPRAREESGWSAHRAAVQPPDLYKATLSVGSLARVALVIAIVALVVAVVALVLVVR